MTGPRLILLIRHPGDVIASALRASGEKSDQLGFGNGHEELRDEAIAPLEDPDFIMANQAARYVDFVGNAKRAYEEHTGPKVLVRYEDLRADTPVAMRRIYGELGMEVDERKLTKAVEEHSQEQVTREGANKLYHDATPRNWRENLTPEQVEVVERVTAPLLGAFYPG